MHQLRRTRLETLSEGVIGEEPLRSFIENDPWGVSPLPYIAHQRWVFVRCADCAQMFHRHVLSPAWNARRFSEWMTEAARRQFLAATDTPENAFNQGRRHVGHAVRIERLTRALRAHQAVRVLDFGCGWGEFLAVCEGFGFFCCGVDPSPARRQNGQIHILPDLERVKALPEAARGFHAITLLEVLEHLDDPLSTLRSLRDHFVPRGILILETPDCAGVSDLRMERKLLQDRPARPHQCLHARNTAQHGGPCRI